MLLDGGGKHVNYLSDTVTHLISNNPDHPDVLEAIEIYEKIVVTVILLFCFYLFFNCEHIYKFIFHLFAYSD